jgi:hypothetical protein
LSALALYERTALLALVAAALRTEGGVGGCVSRGAPKNT